MSKVIDFIEEVNSISCFVCGEHFKNEVAKNDHLRNSHSIAIEVRCFKCSMFFNFNSEASVINHLNSHNHLGPQVKEIENHEIEPEPIPEYEPVSENVIDITEDLQSEEIQNIMFEPQSTSETLETNPKSFDIPIDEDEIEDKESIQAQMEDILNWKFPCDYCVKVLSTKSSLNHHMVTNHRVESEFKCSNCGKCFGSNSILKQHFAHVHEKQRNYKCSQCEKSYTSNYKLKAHFEFVHEQIRRYSCEFCNKAYSTNKQLSIHVTCVHRKERNFKCDKCDLSFGAKHNLTRHTKNVHDD